MEKEDTTSQGKLIKYLKIGLVYITSTESIHHLVLLAIALLGIFGYPVAFFVLLADIVYRNPLIQGTFLGSVGKRCIS